MASKEEGEETPSRTEWEVVSLTASAYAAAPGPEQAELKNDEKGETDGEDRGETSNALFMSGHFVFPPSQHENLPLEPQKEETLGEDGKEEEIIEGEGYRSDTKDDETFNVKSLKELDEIPGIQFLDEGSNRSEFQENSALKGLSLVDKEQSIYGSGTFSSFCDETTVGSPNMLDDDKMYAEPLEPSDPDFDSDISQLPKPSNEENIDGSYLNFGAWLKSHAASLYTQAKEANTFWSIFIAAAVMGIVILGQQWQQERWQVLQYRWQFGINDERMCRMLNPIARLKDVIVGGHRRGSFIRGSASAER